MFVFTFRAVPQNSTALSLWIGVPTLIFNLVVRFLGGELDLLEYTRPLSSAVCIAGSLMLFFMLTRSYEKTNLLLWAVLVVFHWAIGLSAIGVASTWRGAVVCAGVFAVALGGYWVADALGVDAWPYQLAPIELFGLLLPFLVLQGL
jgi:hypothetical protein